jgi:2-polyprenyl-3-methyl-5-hydroxy-6-metoxy-1,4-benzoquinol methylase
MVDIACGRGRHSCMLAKMGFDVTGFDISFESIDYANQFCPKGLFRRERHFKFLPA